MAQMLDEPIDPSEIDPDDFELLPVDAAMDDWRDSDDWDLSVASVARVVVDEVDVAPFMRRSITLEDVVGASAATDVAAEGLIQGFEAGFRYGARWAQERPDVTPTPTPEPVVEQPAPPSRR